MAGELERVRRDFRREAASPREAAPGTGHLPRRITYPAAALALSAGAPAGLLLVRALRCRRWSPSCLRSELSREWPSYVYVALSTAAMFLSLGRVLGRQADRLAGLSETDALTGLNNARVLQRRLREELGRSARYGHPLALLLLDLDRLKTINDRGGHAAGDRALRRVAKAVRSQMRTTDIGARWGGDEFALLAPSTSMNAAVALAERLRASVSRSDDREPLTASLGVAVFEPAQGAGPPDPAHFMAQADAALYQAKQAGRNRVIAAAPTKADTASDSAQDANERNEP
jgi:diguanylate cyclase (GGDEF)-like protein